MNFGEIVKVNVRLSAHGRGLPCAPRPGAPGKDGKRPNTPGGARRFFTFFIVTPKWLCYKNRGEQAAS